MIEFIPYALIGVTGMFALVYHLVRVAHNDTLLKSLKDLVKNETALEQPKVQEYVTRLIYNAQV